MKLIFLQELPTLNGARFLTVPTSKTPIRHTAKSLAMKWEASEEYQQLLAEMKYPTLQDALQLSQSSTKIWYPDQLEYYPEKFWYYFQLCFRSRSSNWSKFISWCNCWIFIF
jgi:hypothetical protein